MPQVSQRVTEGPSPAKPYPRGRCAYVNNPITTGGGPASYFASPLISTVESAQVTARFAMVSLCCDGIRSSKASQTTPCAKAYGFHFVSLISRPTNHISFLSAPSTSLTWG